MTCRATDMPGETASRFGTPSSSCHSDLTEEGLRRSASLSSACQRPPPASCTRWWALLLRGPPPARYYRTMREHRLIAFFLITFGLSWGIPGVLLLASSLGATAVSVDRHSPLSFLFFWAPALSALIVIGLTQGRSGLDAFLRHTVKGKFKWRWWTAVIIGVPLLKLLANALAEDGVTIDVLTTALLGGTLTSGALLALVESPISEFGWRGFALPLLQRRVTGLVAAIFLGVLWAVWYMPWLLPGTVMNWSLGGDSIPAIVRFFAGAIALSVIMTVVFNGSEGSVPLMLVFRWLNNPPHPWELGTHVSYVDAVSTVTAAVILIFVLRNRYLLRRNLYMKVTPGAAAPLPRAGG